MSLPQYSLAATVLASSLGSYYAIFSSPNPNPKSTPSTGDSLNSIFSPFGKAIRLLYALLVTHTACLVYFWPDVPPALLRHGEQNLDADLVTWSARTSLPLILIFFVGLPLRLGSFATLGREFTFALKEPRRLNTGGMYHYVQHPGYTGGGIVVFCNLALLGRLDGSICCLIDLKYTESLVGLQWLLDATALGLFGLAIYTRVKQEEQMLKAKFGDDWRLWHAKTPRFIPWII